MAIQIVSSMENDTGDALFSEILTIPLIIRSEPATRLASGDSTTKLLSGRTTSEALGLPAVASRTTSEALGLPVLSRSDKGRAGLFHGTIFGRLGLPELLR
jgi:hypothetical protein